MFKLKWVLIQYLSDQTSSGLSNHFTAKSLIRYTLPALLSKHVQDDLNIVQGYPPLHGHFEKQWSLPAV